MTGITIDNLFYAPEKYQEYRREHFGHYQNNFKLFFTLKYKISLHICIFIHIYMCIKNMYIIYHFYLWKIVCIKFYCPLFDQLYGFETTVGLIRTREWATGFYNKAINFTTGCTKYFHTKNEPTIIFPRLFPKQLRATWPDPLLVRGWQVERELKRLIITSLIFAKRGSASSHTVYHNSYTHRKQVAYTLETWTS